MSDLASPPEHVDPPEMGPPALDPVGPDPIALDPIAAPSAVVPEQAGPGRAEPPAPPVAGPGTTLATRYRLHTRVGADTAAGAEFWCARDLVLQRDVGVTVLRHRPAERGAVGGEDDPTALERANDMIVRALRSGCFEHAACARLLDVLSPGAAGLPADVLGAAVSEWVPGRSLAEAVADAPLRPVAVARALQPLAAAVEEAHRHGLVLGCDQPQRLRVRTDGGVQLCFALPRTDLRPADDVRGLGAILVTLLTSRWPLSGADAARAGLATIGRTPGGAVEPPSMLRAGVPTELDALATGTLGPVTADNHVHTAAAVNQLLTEVVEEHDSVALLPPLRDGLPTDPADVWQDGRVPEPPADPDRRRRMRIALASLAAVVLVIVGYAAFQLTSLFSDPAAPAIVVDDTTPGAAAGGRTAVAGVEIYGAPDADNAARVTRVIDGDQASSWRTSTYRQQLPALKPGIGVMISFVSPVQLSSMSIASPSPGTRLEVRAAPSADAAFPETVRMASTVIDGERTSLSLAQSQPVQYVLVWIDQLGGGDGQFVTEINELEFRRALA
ncbi:MAG: protein kinase family protein [Pseudonocardia sp.]